MDRVIHVPQVSSRREHPVELEHYYIDEQTNEVFLSQIVGPQIYFTSRNSLATVNVHDYGYNLAALPFFAAPTTSLMVQTLHGAFSGHKAISLRPDTLWYMIVHQTVEHIRQNSGNYAHLFQAGQGNSRIEVNWSGDWATTIQHIGKKLALIAGNDIAALFAPNFSTTTEDDRLAMLVALMDAASPYYDIQIKSICHIPTIRLEGTPEDWAMLIERTAQLQGIFHGLYAYFDHLLLVLTEIAKAAHSSSEVNAIFWRSIYKHDSSSGGELITGWITAFLAHVQTAEGSLQRTYFGEGDLTIQNFPSHVSTVQFMLDTAPMVFAGGVTSVDYNDGFLVPRLGVAVAQIT